MILLYNAIKLLDFALEFRCACSIRNLQEEWCAQMNMLLCVAYCMQQTTLIFKQFHFHWAKTWEIWVWVCVCSACLTMGAKSPPQQWTAIKFSCKRTHCTSTTSYKSVHIVIIPFTDFKVFDFNYKLRKTAKLCRYLFCAAQKICNLCPWCECAKDRYSNNLPRTL